MKKSFLILLGGVLFIASCNNQSGESSNTEGAEATAMDTVSSNSEVSLEQVWASENTLETPESVFYNEDADILYVSNIVGESNAKDGKGYISKLSLDGEIVEQEWVSGLDAPKGMAMLDGNLYVTNVDELVEINIESGEITNRFKVENAKFLNDAETADDKVLFTDMEDNKIYALENGTVQLWKETTLNRPNGLAFNNGQVLVASNGLSVVSEEGEPETLADGIDASDGIGVVDDNSYLVSNWNGEVYYVEKGQEKVKLLDTKDQNMNTADITYIKDRNLLLIPTFKDNRVVAYKLNK